MFTFALSAAFDDSADHASDVRRMLGAWPGAPSDGHEFATSPHAGAGVSRWAVVARDRRVRPYWDTNGKILVAGDVRLYNRRDLEAALGTGPSDVERTDLEIATQAYFRWGSDAPRRFVGDFAFVAWHERERLLFAARDQLGLRPLHYHFINGRVRVASEVVQLLPFVDRALESVNAERILERFSGRARVKGQTYFRDIHALKPGHHITIDIKGTRQQLYWLPPAPEAKPSSYAETCEAFLSGFRTAVSDRLESDHPIVMHSSGGFDSSTIVAMTRELQVKASDGPPILTAAATAFGYDCDDSRFMTAVDDRTGFEGVRWSALESDLSDVTAPDPGRPGERRGPGGGPRGDLDLAKARGARVLIGGMCGDTVTVAWGIGRDLFRHGRWVALGRELFGRMPPRVAFRQLIKATFGVFPPPLAVRMVSRLSERKTLPPRWMGPALRAIYPPPREHLDVEFMPVGVSHLSCVTWARIGSPQASDSTESTVRYGAQEGIEVRLPYTDVRLLEHILKTPWDQRVPHGDLRRLGRDSLQHLLPPIFASRTSQGSWKPVWALGARRMLPLVNEMLDDEWLSAPFVERDQARQMCRCLLAEGENADLSTTILVAEFGVLEAWLRRVLRYDVDREVT